MKELNKFIDKLDKQCPRAYNKEIDVYGVGKTLQVIIMDKKCKDFEIKENVETGLYVSKYDTAIIYEILYKSNAERKKYLKDLIEKLKEELNNKIVYLSCYSKTKESLLLQLFVLDEVKKLEL